MLTSRKSTDRKKCRLMQADPSRCLFADALLLICDTVYSDFFFFFFKYQSGTFTTSISAEILMLYLALLLICDTVFINIFLYKSGTHTTSIPAEMLMLYLSLLLICDTVFSVLIFFYTNPVHPPQVYPAKK